jgi:hypothetical protein
MYKILFFLIAYINIYLLSAYGLYKWNQKAYSKNGYWENDNIKMPEFIFMFFPIINTILFITSLFVSPFKKEYKPLKIKYKRDYTIFLNNFFKIQK